MAFPKIQIPPPPEVPPAEPEVVTLFDALNEISQSIEFYSGKTVTCKPVLIAIY